MFFLFSGHGRGPRTSPDKIITPHHQHIWDPVTPVEAIKLTGAALQRYIYLSIYSLIYAFIHVFMYIFIHAFIYSFIILAFIYTFIH